MQVSDQLLQKTSVWTTANHGSTGRGGASCDGYQVSRNGSCWPSSMVNSATVRSPSPWVSARVHSATASGPAVAVSRCSWWVTQGMASP